MGKKQADGADLLAMVEKEAESMPWQKCEREGCDEQAKFFRFCIAHVIEEMESDIKPKAPKPRVYHRAKKMNAAGQVSARCFVKPRPINLKRRVSWTLRDQDTTCPKCLKIIAAKVSHLTDEARGIG